MTLLGDVSPLAFQVWRRNLDVYVVTWRTAIVSLAEPVFNFLAFGYGIGAVTPTLPFGGREIPYAEFVAPGVIAMAVMFQSFFECLYGTYIRMYYQRTFDAITATPASLDDVIVGEALWGTTRAFLGTLSTLLVVWAFGYARTWTVVAVPVLAAAAGLLFSAAGLCFTGMVKNIESINYPLHLVGVPLYLFGGLFFPIDTMPAWAQRASLFNPMAHLCTALREACLGSAGPGVWLAALGLLAAGTLLLGLAVRLMRRRLVR